MRDRLIELLAVGNQKAIDAKPAFQREAICIIADYLLANGVIVPPCKVGDTVWVKDFMWGLIPCKVDEPYHYVCGESGGCTLEGCFTDKDIGKTVFLTKEQAEQALKEREQV